VVEARAPLTSAGELDSATWNAVSEALKRTASDATVRHGGCRVVADFAPGAPLRWHVLPRAH
jgi:hypothetical protein